MWETRTLSIAQWGSFEGKITVQNHFKMITMQDHEICAIFIPRYYLYVLPYKLIDRNSRNIPHVLSKNLENLDTGIIRNSNFMIPSYLVYPNGIFSLVVEFTFS